MDEIAKLSPEVAEAIVVRLGQVAADHPGTKQTFGRDLHAAVPELTMARPRNGSGGRLRYYQGLDLVG